MPDAMILQNARLERFREKGAGVAVTARLSNKDAGDGGGVDTRGRLILGSML
jgi:hypothetical protein